MWCAQQRHIFQHFLIISFLSVTCTHSGEEKQKAIYAAQYQIALSWQGASPLEAVSVWEGGDACKSASNRRNTEKSAFFLINKKRRVFYYFILFYQVLDYINKTLPDYLYFIWLHSFISCAVDMMVILQKSVKCCQSVVSEIMWLRNNTCISEKWL